MKRILLIVNKASRNGTGDRATARRAFEEHGVHITARSPLDPFAAQSLILSEAKRHDAIVVAGGDGTLFQVAEALIKAGRPVGILPIGTANDLAHNLAIPHDPRRAAHVVMQGHTVPIALGKVNGKFFFNVAHLGAGAGLLLRVRKNIKKRWGRLSFFPLLFRELLHSAPTTYQLECDGMLRSIKACQLTIANGSYVGGNFKIAPQEFIAANRLNLYALNTVNPFRLIPLLPAMRKGNSIHSRQAWVVSCKSIVVHSSRQRPIVADGEYISQTPATFGMAADALRIFVTESVAKGFQT